MLTHFRWPLIVNLIAIVASFIIWGPAAAFIVVLLTILEVTFSFDNAVVNAKTLRKMPPFWQKIFLTIGILIAVFGMRLVFPVILVAIAAGLSPLEALRLGINDPHKYSEHLHHAHPVIAAFGGMFLFMLFLTWLVENKEHHWLKIEALAERYLKYFIYALGTSVVIYISYVSNGWAPIIAGYAGILSYFLISRVDTLFEKIKLPSVGLGAFLYLEVLDASFSFDGVIGAFAITTNIFLIMIGLGIGAAYVRSMTVYLVNKGTLSEYRYLEHGAHWAIFALAVILLLSIKVSIPDVLTGILGVAIIGIAFYQSIKINKSEALKGTL